MDNKEKRWILTVRISYCSVDFMFNDGYQALKIVEQLTAALENTTDKVTFNLHIQEVENASQDEQTIQE